MDRKNKLATKMAFFDEQDAVNQDDISTASEDDGEEPAAKFLKLAPPKTEQKPGEPSKDSTTAVTSISTMTKTSISTTTTTTTSAVRTRLRARLDDTDSGTAETRRKAQAAPSVKKGATLQEPLKPSKHDAVAQEKTAARGPPAKAKSTAKPKAVAKPSAKRKREKALPDIPESEQIFKGKELYFIPNSDIDLGRRLRIRHAQRYGATWAEEWNDDVTHVIVDKPIEFKEVMKFLKLSERPREIVLVNEVYPSDCIRFGRLLNPALIQYEVEGRSRFEKLQSTAATVSIADGSRKLQAGLADEAQKTPSPSEGSESGRRPFELVKKIKTVIPGLEPQRRAELMEKVTVKSPVPTLPQPDGSRELSGQGTGRPVDPVGPLTAGGPRDPSDQATVAATRDAVDQGTESERVDGPPDMPQLSQQKDALDEAIAEAQQVEGLPVDSTDDDAEPASDDDDAKSRDTKRQRRLTRADKTLDKTQWQEKFMCMQKHDGISERSNPNARTIELLQRMADYYALVNDHWRTIGYRKAISQLKRMTQHITTKEQARQIPGVGERIAEKIEEIVRTDRLRRLDSTATEPTDTALKLFLNVYGIGHSHATALIAQGHRTLDDLRTEAKLTANQKIGIEHYDNFLTRIPRSEVEAHGRLVETALASVDARIQATIGGSYRRGAPDSGDVDCIITAPDMSISTLRTLIVETAIPLLFDQGYLQCTLSATGHHTGTKWHGAAVLPGAKIWRRIDFLLVPFDEWGAALIYFTGNDIFNRSMRLLASKKGYRLNQKGLWKDVIRGPNRERITQGTLVEGRSEEKIFEVLGVPWRPPEHRIC